MRALRLGCLIAALIVLAGAVAARAKLPEVNVTKTEGPIEIEADRLTYDRERQIYEADGQVQVTRGGLSFRADHAQMNPVSKEVVAWGKVVLREGENVLECDRLELDLETQLGRIFQARFFLKDQNYHVTGQEAEKLGENHYRVREGSITTCDGERPPWKFTVKELEVTVGGQGVATRPVFYLEGIPILALPKAVFPVRQERQSGFLLPEGGYSSRNGVIVRDGFYWAIRKDMDATIYFSLEGERGFKEGVEFRYAFSKDTKGQANFYYINDRVYDGSRDALFLRHEQTFSYDFYLKADINYVSDISYFRDFEDDLPSGAMLDARSMRLLRSVLFGGKNWDQFSFLADGMAFIDLTRESNDRTVQALPQVSFYGHPQSLFRNFVFWDLTSSYTNFYRKEGVEAHRWDLFPRVSFPTRLFNGLKLEPFAGVRETFYKTSHDPTGRLDGTENRLIFQGGVQASSELYRVYEDLFPKVSSLFGVTKWMHTIEPFVGYLYNPGVSQEDLPVFDNLDRIPYANQISYGVTQRLVGKPAKEGVTSGPREYARLTLLQSYSLGDPFEITRDGEKRYFSDINAELWYYFNPYLSGRVRVAFNPYDLHFSQFNGLLDLRDRRNDGLHLEYLYTKDQVQEANLYARFRTIDPLYLSGGIRYNILENTPVETYAGGFYQAQCWSLGLTYNYIYASPNGLQPRDQRYWVHVSLLGIGAIGHKPFYMELQEVVPFR